MPAHGEKDREAKPSDPLPRPLFRERDCAACGATGTHRRFYSRVWGEFWTLCLACGAERAET